MRRFIGIVTLVAACVLPLTAASSLSTYANSVAGESQLGAAGPPLSCTTFAPTTQVRNALLYGNVPAVPFPTETPCGVQQNLNEQAGVTGPITSSSALNRTFAIDAIESVIFNGSSQGRANYFNIGTTATASYTGGKNNMTVVGSEAFAISRETLTIPGATGQAGTFRATITLDGSLSATGPGSAYLDLFYYKDDGSQFVSVRFNVDPRGATPPFIQNPVPGAPVFTVTQTSVTGSTQVTIDIPIIFGTPFDVSIGLFSSVIPATTGSWNSTFLTSAKLTGIAVSDAGGNPLPSFTVQSGSGTQYGPGGIIPPVPNQGVFTSFATSGGAIPGGVGVFGSFPQGSAVAAGRVGFLGLGTGGQQGLYTCDPAAPVDPCRPLADLSKAIPGGSGTFTGFGELVLSRVGKPDPPPIRAAFLGMGGAGQQGIYTCDALIPVDPCRPVADRAKAIPGGAGAFTGFSQLAMSGSIAGFIGTGAGQAGVYTCDTAQPVDPCRPVASLATAIPNGTGMFTSFGDLALAMDMASPTPPPIRVAFSASGGGAQGVQQGVYACNVTQPTDPCRRLADLTTAIPGGTGAFTGFGAIAATIDPTTPPDPIRVAFIGIGAGQQGIYSCGTAAPTDPCLPIANLTTAVPQGTGTFAGFTALSASGAHLAFLATDGSGRAGIYLASAPMKVVAVGDALLGKTVAALRLGQFGLDNESLTFAATFTDGSQGVFSVVVPGTPAPPPPPPPTVVSFASFQPAAAIDVRNGAFAAAATFTLGAGSNGIAPVTEAVTLRVGTFTTTIPAGSFRSNGFGNYSFRGTSLIVALQFLGGQKWLYSAVGWNANMTGTVNPVTVGLTVGNDGGSATTNAFFGTVPH